MTNYIYSTLTDSMNYTIYEKTNNELPRVKRKIFIRGGANLPTKHLITPQGAVTEVDDETLSALRQDKVFQIHEKNGFIKVDSHKKEIETAVMDMEKRDEASPLTPEDYTHLEEKKRPRTGGSTNKSK